jgi:cell wall-associated NlpC family hydrolase
MQMRLDLVANAQKNAAQPDAAAQTYQLLGFNTSAALAGHRTSVHDLKPGDLVGWEGGHEPDGRYIGNMAVYAGNGEIIESYYGNNRRRRLDPHENTFGLPVVLPDDEGLTDQTPDGGGTEV